eukprot:30966-Pelagococcus_subviridis.AAC.4
MVLATAKNGDDELSFTVGNAAIASHTSIPSTTSPTTTFVRSRISATSDNSSAPLATVTVNAVPFGPGGGGSVTVTNFPFMLTSFSLGGGGGDPRSTIRLTTPRRSCDSAFALSSGSKPSAEFPPGRPSTGVVLPGMTNARTPQSPTNNGTSAPPSSAYSIASICVRLYPSPLRPLASVRNRAAEIGFGPSPYTPKTTLPAGTASTAKSKKTLDVIFALAAGAASAGAAVATDAADAARNDASDGRNGDDAAAVSATRRDVLTSGTDASASGASEAAEDATTAIGAASTRRARRATTARRRRDDALDDDGGATTRVASARIVVAMTVARRRVTRTRTRRRRTRTDDDGR